MASTPYVAFTIYFPSRIISAMATKPVRVRKMLGKRLRERRLQLGLTQDAMAERADLITRHYQKIESGEVNVTLDTICKLADAAKTTLGELLG